MGTTLTLLGFADDAAVLYGAHVSTSISAITSFDPFPMDGYRSKVAGQVRDFAVERFLDSAHGERVDRASQAPRGRGAVAGGDLEPVAVILILVDPVGSGRHRIDQGRQLRRLERRRPLGRLRRLLARLLAAGESITRRE